MGSKPKTVSDELDIPYATALKLNKELLQAEERDTIESLFDMDKAALDLLLQQVKDNLVDLSASLSVPEEAIEGSVDRLSSSVGATQLLETELAAAATIVAKQIATRAAAAQSSDALLVLAEALSKLQASYFAKGNNVQINNMSGFERYLRD